MTDTVLFGQSYFLRFDPKLWAAMQPYPPLGTMYAASYLRGRGYELALRSRAGRLLRSSRQGFNPDHALDYTVCGRHRLRLVIRSKRPHSGPFRLQIERP